MSLIERIGGRASRLFKRSLADLHPELIGREHLKIVGGLGDAFGAGRAKWDYANHVWVHKAITVLANNFASLSLSIVPKGEDTELETHPLLELFQFVNPLIPPGALWVQWLTDMMLFGEAGLELTRTLNGQFAEIWIRHSHEITIRVNRKTAYNQLLGYRLEVDDAEPYSLPPEDMLMSRFYNPSVRWRGLAPITAIRMGLSIDQLSQAWSRLFFKNSARPDMVIIAEQGLTRAELDDLEDRFTDQIGGLGKAHSIIALEDGIMDVKPIGAMPKDTEWIEQRKLSREETGGLFGVPDELMGWGKDTYENFKQAMRFLWTVTLIPLVKLRDNSLTEFFHTEGSLEPELQFLTNLTNIPALQEDLLDKARQAARFITSGWPINVVNERLNLGFPEMEGGWVGYINQGLIGAYGSDIPPIPEEQVEMFPAVARQLRRNSGQTVQEICATFGFKMALISQFESGIRSHGLIASDLQNYSRALDIEPEHLKAFMTLGAAYFKDLPVEPLCTKWRLLEEFGSDEHKLVWLLFESKTRGFESTFGGKLRDEFSRQEDDVTSKVIGFDAVEQIMLTDVFSINVEIGLWLEIFRPVIEAIVLSGALNAMDLTGEVPGIVFDPASPDVISAIDAILVLFVGAVMSTTEMSLAGLITTGIDEGWSVNTLADEIGKLFTQFRGPRALTIARTEIARSFNAGQLEALKQMSIPRKMWISQLDDRVRETHLEAHGQVRGVDAPFLVGGESLMFPLDPNGSPENTINCRCTLAPVLE